MQQKPRSRIIQVMDGSKGPRVIQVLADNNTGHFRAEDKSLCNYDLKETRFPQTFSLFTIFFRLRSISFRHKRALQYISDLS